MRSDHKFMAAMLFWIGILTVYVCGYLASVTRVQISYGNSSGPLIAIYGHPWQRVLFSPLEQVDRMLFPTRWGGRSVEKDKPSNPMRTSPNQALQRTRLRVTAHTSATTFPPTTQAPRRSGVSLGLGVLGVTTVWLGLLPTTS